MPLPADGDPLPDLVSSLPLSSWERVRRAYKPAALKRRTVDVWGGTRSSYGRGILVGAQNHTFSIGSDAYVLDLESTSPC
jgi:hypothetical protein